MKTKSKTETFTDKIGAAIAPELEARNVASRTLAHLKTERVRLINIIAAEAKKRTELVLSRVELIKDGGDVTGLDTLVEDSRIRENTDKASLEAIESSLPAEKNCLMQAEAMLRRKALDAIKSLRPDDKVNALFAKAMDAVDAWRTSYNGLIQEFGIKLTNGDHQGQWYLGVDAHLTNANVVRLNEFVPKVKSPEPSSVAT